MLFAYYLNKNAGGCAGGLAGIPPSTALVSPRISRLTPSTRVAPADALVESRAGGVLWEGRTTNRTMEANVVRDGQAEEDFLGPLG